MIATAMEAAPGVPELPRHSTPPRAGWLARLGLKMVAAGAGGDRPAAGRAGAFPEGAFGWKGGGPMEGGMACCQLALPDRECQYVGDKSNYTCPEGWHRQYWTCCDGTRIAGCGECTRSTSTCWVGPFECSIWWWTGQSC